MLRNQIKEVTHHSKEIKSVVTKRTRVEPWVVAKMERAATDLSDVTHYLDGERYEDGGNIDIDYWQKKDLPYLYHNGEARFTYYGYGGYDVVYDQKLENVFIRGHKLGNGLIFKNHKEAEDFINNSSTYADGGSTYADGWVLYDQDTEKLINIFDTESEAREMMYEYSGNANVVEKSVWDSSSTSIMAKGGSMYADGGEIKVGDQFVNTERGEKFYIEKIDTSDKSFPFYVLKSKPTDFPEVIGRNEFERYYKAGLYKKMAHGGSMYAGGGNIFKNERYNITYEVRPSASRSDRWEVVESSPKWEEENVMTFVSEEDALDYAKISSGVKKESDPESMFMRRTERFDDGGNVEKIAKLEKVLTSTLVPESVKEKARMEIERLKSESSESTSGLSAEQRDFNKKVLSIIDRENISQPNQFEEIISEALQDANFHTEAYKFAKLSDPTIQSKEDWYQSTRFRGDDLTTQLGIEIANKAGWNGNYISEAMQFVLRMKGYHKIADALKGAMEEEDRYPNRIESTTEKQNFFIKEIATRTATDQRAVTEFVKDNGLTESETLNIVQGLGMGKIKPMDFVTALMGNVEFENNIVSFAKSNEAFKTPEQKPSIRTAVEPKTKSIRTAVVETKVETPMETAVESKQAEIKDTRLKGKKISDVSTYIAHWNIDSITFTLDGKTYTVKGSDIFDGVYVENKAIGVKAKRTTKAKQPKVTRTQFEEEEFEFGKGGKA
jgi:hypothetical protein